MAALIPTVVFGGLAGYLAWDGNRSSDTSATADKETNDREKAEKAAADRVAKGAPIKVTRGEAPSIAYQFAFRKRTYNFPEVADSTEWDQRFNDWLTTNGGRPIGLYSVRFTIKALKADTTTIQDFRLKNRHCSNEVAATVDDVKRNMHGTLVFPPAMGGPGEDVKRDVLGFDVSQYDALRAYRMKDGYPKLGVPSEGSDTQVPLERSFSANPVVMEQNDARTFDVYFASGLDCTFGLEVNVTVDATDTWVTIPIGAGWDKGNSTAIAGPDEPYDTLVRPKADGAGMEAGNAMREGGVPSVSITVNDVP